ncbi:MAG: M28 family peptidase [Acutalibacteraceae bacterium]|nr:M28 family peptidase [Acutalibacteraceae bacterium]
MSTAQQGAKMIFDFCKVIIDKHGPRLPGSAEEKAAQKDIAAIMENATGVKPKVEKFMLAPRASIGAIPYLGYAGFVALALYYIHPIPAFIVSLCTLLFAVVQVFTYKGWFDRFFKQEESCNVYSVMDGKGPIDHTIVFSGHADSSWLWQMAAKNPKTMILRTVLGVVGVVSIIIGSLLRFFAGMWSVIKPEELSTGYYLFLLITPLLFVYGLYSLCVYLTHDKKKASPGAMDNLTGVGASIFMGKYFKENPDKLPDNCRVIIASLGSEEAGLKGSEAFMKAHAGDENLLINPYFFNIDSLRDYEHFNAVKGDSWLMSKFDDDMKNMLVKAFENAGVKPNIIVNPVGGCDSTPICRAGYKTITFAAQKPDVTDYYHTYRDTCDGLDMNTLEKSVDIIIDVTEQIHEHHKKNGYHLTKCK